MKLIRIDLRDFGLRNGKNETTNLGTAETVKAEGKPGLEENKQKSGLSCWKKGNGLI